MNSYWEADSNIVKNFKPYWTYEIILVNWLFAAIVYVKGSAVICPVAFI